MPIQDDELERCTAKKGDLLICEGGEAGRAAVWPHDYDISFQNHVHRARFYGGINPYFVQRFFEKLKATGEIDKFRKGVGISNMSGKALASIVLPLPPLAEQKRIVAKVDELMALCDRLEAQQQERDTRHAALARASLARFAEAPTPANLDFLFHNAYTITPADLRKSILTLAVQGKLAANCETKHVVLSEVIELISGQHLLTHEHNEAGNGIPYLTGPSDFGARHPNPTRWTETPKVVAEPGDILITVKGSGVGKTNKLVAERTAISRQLMAVRVTKADPDFVHLVLMNAADYFQSSMTGIAIPGIGRKDVLSLEVELPPLAEQRRIVAKVDQLMALMDQLETQLTAAKATNPALLDAVVHELINPTAEVIDFPRAKRDPLADRAAIGCYVIQKMAGKRYFGRTAAMKLLYLAETHLGLNLGGKPLRDAAGPFDQWIYRFEKEGGQEKWFKTIEGSTSEGHKKIEYRPESALTAKAALAESAFTAVQGKEFDRLLTLFADRTTEEVEIIATLFAAWNDFLIDGHVPGDDEVVEEVRENWHAKKKRFTPTQLRQWLGWLRQNALIPKGRLPRTAHQSRPLLD